MPKSLVPVNLRNLITHVGGMTEFRRAAVSLLILDLLLLVANVVHHVVNQTDNEGHFQRTFRWPGWHGGTDGSVIEIAGYAQLLTAAFLLLTSASRERHRVYLPWGAILVCVALDDFLQLHERAGEILVDVSGPWRAFGLRSQDVGELSFWAVVAVPLGAWLVLAHRQSETVARLFSWALIGCMFFLAVFAVGADMLHSVLASALEGSAEAFFELIETSGELVGMSLILVFSVAVRFDKTA